MAHALADMRQLFQKSVAVTRSLAKGTVLTRDMLTAKKPANGIPEKAINSLVGKRLKRAAAPDRVLHGKTSMTSSSGGRRKVCVVVNSRANYGRIKSVLELSRRIRSSSCN